MKRSKFYVCPVCGNVITATGEAAVSCHGIALPPLFAEESDLQHVIHFERVEDEYFVTCDHEMSKEHYISFFAAINDNSVTLKKLYPESAAQARFKINGFDTLYAFCNRHGLFEIKPPKTPNYKAEAKLRWGTTDAFKQSEQKERLKSDAQKQSDKDGLLWIFQKFGKIKDQSPKCADALALVGQLKQFITDNYYDCTDQILGGLADTYVNDARFTENIDKNGGKGTAIFVSNAIKEFLK